MTRSFVLLRTDLFLARQPDEDIGHWLVGADCAGWLYARLLPVSGIVPSREPIMEDWGWSFVVATNGVPVTVNVWQFFPVSEDCWLLGLETRKRWFFRETAEALPAARAVVADAIEEICLAESRILKHEWFAENPFELGRESF